MTQNTHKKIGRERSRGETELGTEGEGGEEGGKERECERERGRSIFREKDKHYTFIIIKKSRTAANTHTTHPHKYKQIHTNAHIQTDLYPLPNAIPNNPRKRESERERERDQSIFREKDKHHTLM